MHVQQIVAGVVFGTAVFSALFWAWPLIVKGLNLNFRAFACAVCAALATSLLLSYLPFDTADGVNNREARGDEAEHQQQAPSEGAQRALTFNSPEGMAAVDHASDVLGQLDVGSIQIRFEGTQWELLDDDTKIFSSDVFVHNVHSPLSFTGPGSSLWPIVPPSETEPVRPEPNIDPKLRLTPAAD